MRLAAEIARVIMHCLQWQKHQSRGIDLGVHGAGEGETLSQGITPNGGYIRDRIAGIVGVVEKRCSRLKTWRYYGGTDSS